MAASKRKATKKKVKKKSNPVHPAVKAERKATIAHHAKIKKLADLKAAAKKRASAKKRAATLKKNKAAAKRKAASKKKVAKKTVSKKKVAKKKVAKKKTGKKVAKKKVAKKVGKKKTGKKVAKKKTGKKKAVKRIIKAPKANRKKRKSITNKLKKNQVLMTGWKASGRKKSKTKGRKFEKILMTKRTNPIGGTMLNKVNKMTKDYINHEVSEIGGLFSGGVLHGAANDLITRYVPANILAKFEGALGPFAGSAAPILVGALLSKFGGKNNVVKSVSKGMIGAGIVGLGASAYQIVKPAESTMSGYPLLSDEVDSEIGNIETSDFGTMDEDYGEVETSDFGEYVNETDDFGYMDEYYEEY